MCRTFGFSSQHRKKSPSSSPSDHPPQLPASIIEAPLQGQMQTFPKMDKLLENIYQLDSISNEDKALLVLEFASRAEAGEVLPIPTKTSSSDDGGVSNPAPINFTNPDELALESNFDKIVSQNQKKRFLQQRIQQKHLREAPCLDYNLQKHYVTKKVNGKNNQKDIDLILANDGSVSRGFGSSKFFGRNISNGGRFGVWGEKQTTANEENYNDDDNNYCHQYLGNVKIAKKYNSSASVNDVIDSLDISEKFKDKVKNKVKGIVSNAIPGNNGISGKNSNEISRKNSNGTGGMAQVRVFKGRRNNQEKTENDLQIETFNNNGVDSKLISERGNDTTGMTAKMNSFHGRLSGKEVNQAKKSKSFFAPSLRYDDIMSGANATEAKSRNENSSNNKTAVANRSHGSGKVDSAAHVSNGNKSSNSLNTAYGARGEGIRINPHDRAQHTANRNYDNSVNAVGTVNNDFKGETPSGRFESLTNDNVDKDSRSTDALGGINNQPIENNETNNMEGAPCRPRGWRQYAIESNGVACISPDTVGGAYDESIRFSTPENDVVHTSKTNNTDDCEDYSTVALGGGNDDYLGVDVGGEHDEDNISVVEFNASEESLDPEGRRWSQFSNSDDLSAELDRLEEGVESMKESIKDFALKNLSNSSHSINSSPTKNMSSSESLPPSPRDYTSENPSSEAHSALARLMFSPSLKSNSPFRSSQSLPQLSPRGPHERRLSDDLAALLSTPNGWAPIVSPQVIQKLEPTKFYDRKPSSSSKSLGSGIDEVRILSRRASYGGQLLQQRQQEDAHTYREMKRRQTIGANEEEYDDYIDSLIESEPVNGLLQSLMGHGESMDSISCSPEASPADEMFEFRPYRPIQQGVDNREAQLPSPPFRPLPRKDKHGFNLSKSMGDSSKSLVASNHHNIITASDSTNNSDLSRDSNGRTCHYASATIDTTSIVSAGNSDSVETSMLNPQSSQQTTTSTTIYNEQNNVNTRKASQSLPANSNIPNSSDGANERNSQIRRRSTSDSPQKYSKNTSRSVSNPESSQSATKFQDQIMVDSNDTSHPNVADRDGPSGSVNAEKAKGRNRRRASCDPLPYQSIDTSNSGKTSILMSSAASQLIDGDRNVPSAPGTSEMKKGATRRRVNSETRPLTDRSSFLKKSFPKPPPRQPQVTDALKTREEKKDNPMRMLQSIEGDNNLENSFRSNDSKGNFRRRASSNLAPDHSNDTSGSVKRRAPKPPARTTRSAPQSQEQVEAHSNALSYSIDDLLNAGESKSKNGRKFSSNSSNGDIPNHLGSAGSLRHFPQWPSSHEPHLTICQPAYSENDAHLAEKSANERKDRNRRRISSDVGDNLHNPIAQSKSLSYPHRNESISTTRSSSSDQNDGSFTPSLFNDYPTAEEKSTAKGTQPSRQPESYGPKCPPFSAIVKDKSSSLDSSLRSAHSDRSAKKKSQRNTIIRPPTSPRSNGSKQKNSHVDYPTNNNPGHCNSNDDELENSLRSTTTKSAEHPARKIRDPTPPRSYRRQSRRYSALEMKDSGFVPPPPPRRQSQVETTSSGGIKGTDIRFSKRSTM